MNRLHFLTALKITFTDHFCHTQVLTERNNKIGESILHDSPEIVFRAAKPITAFFSCGKSGEFFIRVDRDYFFPELPK
jgi:hypothetical protein